MFFKALSQISCDLRKNCTMGLVKHITDSVVAKAIVKRGEDLWRFLLRHKRTAGETDRSVNEETYLRLLRLPRNDLVGDPLAYVYRVSANVLDEEELRRPPPSAVERPRWTKNPLDNLFLAKDRTDVTGAKVQEALQKLSPVCRAVLVLHRRDGMTYDEIAEHLGISPAAVRQHLAAGLRHCCVHLQNLG